MVALICGACRREELTNVSVKDIETHGDIILVKIPNTKNKIPRSFTIDGPFAEIVKKYQSLRSSKGKSDRFFQNFQRGRCTAQVKFTARGLMMPVFTSLNNDFTVNFGAIPGYLQYVLQSGFKSVLVAGTTGESATLTVADRKKEIDLWVAAAKPSGLHVQVQVGGAPFPDVQELAKHCQSVGVDSLLTMPELYFKPKTADELVSYVGLVAQAAPKLPVLYYNNPPRSRVEVNMPEFVAKATASIPNFKGLKFSPKDLSEGAQVLRILKNDQEMFVSADTLLAPAALLGVKSYVCTSFNLFPQLAQDIIAAVEASDVPKARALQETLSLAVEAITVEGEWVPAFKAGMEIVTGLKVGPPSQVQKPLTSEAKTRMEGKLKALKLVK